jgi:hypothetical protein
MMMREYLTGSGGVIYYVRDRGIGPQHELLLDGKDIAVIDGSWGVEGEFLHKYAQLFDKEIRQLEAESDLLFECVPEVDEAWRMLELRFQQAVGVEARAVHFRPSALPAVLLDKPLDEDPRWLQVQATGDQIGFSASWLRRAFVSMKQNKADPSQSILYLNATSDLMQELRVMQPDDTFRLILKVIYNNAFVLACQYIPPDRLDEIFDTNNAAIAAMIRNVRRVIELERERAALLASKTSHELALEQERLVELRKILDKHFSEDELRTLCFDLKVTYDDLPSEQKSGKARELVAYLERHNRIADLIEVGKKQRPNLPWDVTF